jgi:hypothetical protein
MPRRRSRCLSLLQSLQHIPLSRSTERGPTRATVNLTTTGVTRNLAIMIPDRWKACLIKCKLYLTYLS